MKITTLKKIKTLPSYASQARFWASLPETDLEIRGWVRVKDHPHCQMEKCGCLKAVNITRDGRGRAFAFVALDDVKNTSKTLYEVEYDSILFGLEQPV